MMRARAENAAENLRNTAEAVREEGKAKAKAIDERK